MAKYILFLLLIASWSAIAEEHSDKKIGTIRSPDGRPCILFQLIGVSQADPAIPEVPWFAIRQNNPGYKEMLSMIMSAKLTDKLVSVSTSGSIACDHADVSVIHLQ
jgi:hypothetical protein